MVSGINMTAVYVADFIGILILLLILLVKGWDIPGRRSESRILFVLILASLIDCILDAFVSYADGKPGKIIRTISIGGNSLLYIYNLIVGSGILALVAKHINKKISRSQYITAWVLVILETLLLVVNIFEPVVFSLDENNVYARQPFYIIYLIAAAYLVGYCLIIYISARLRDGSLRYFPVWEFLIPILLGVIIQVFCYGISLQPVCFAVAFGSIVICLQKENLYIDKLTGAYNRYELEKILHHYKKRHMNRFAAIMLDMNDFKAINDNYSHKEGDEALCNLVKILVSVVTNEGNVIRFAGDEFIVLINECDKEELEEYIGCINESIDNYNKTSGKPYQLSAAIGGDSFEITDERDFLSVIDNLMYENKSEYYKTHDRRRGR